MKGFEDTPTNWAPASVWTDDEGVAHQTIEFVVPGAPIGQGNMTQNRYGIIYDSTKGLRPWREMVTGHALRAMNMARNKSAGLQKFTSSVGLHVCFVMPRPKSYPKTKFVPATKKPDLDKLMRAIGDALTDARVWVDDSQVVESFASKRLADFGESPGVHILVTSKVMPEIMRGLRIVSISEDGGKAQSPIHYGLHPTGYGLDRTS